MIDTIIQIVCAVVVLVSIPINIHYRRITRIHNRATQWYYTHSLAEPKPDYVLESERLRALKGKP
jgi:hypothetical protein